MKKALALVVISVVLLSGVAFAETVSGKVSSVDTQANALEVTVIDVATGAESKSNISVNAETKYATVASLAELKQGDEITAEVKKDEATGVLWATSIELGAGKTAEAAPAAEAAAPAAQ